MAVLITGANGFLGQHVKEKFISKGVDVLTPRSYEMNLTDSIDTLHYFSQHKVDCVIHLAALCGGIGLNQKRPGDLILENLKMTSNIFNAIRIFNVEYFYGTGSVCSYPVNCPVPFKEDDMWSGAPEETNASYGEYKRSLVKTFQAFRAQFGLSGAMLIPVNLFGPKDHFDLENSHVIPALIRKFVEARDSVLPTVTVWGTGRANREFLYAPDAAEAIYMAFEQRLDTSLPINLGTGQSIQIKELACLIKKLTNYHGDVIFDISRPDGQLKRQLDVSRAKEMIGFEAKTSFEDGLRETIRFFEEKYV